MSKLPFMKLFVDDWLADTKRLTTIQHGAYFLLICEYWRDQNSLVNDDEELSAICGMDIESFIKIKTKLMKYFKEKNGRLTHNRVEKILKESKAAHKKRSDAGRKGGKAKPKHCLSNTQAMFKQPEPEPEPEPEPKSKKDTNVFCHSFPYDEIVNLWNNRFSDTNIPKIVKLSDARKKILKARFKDTFENNLDFVEQTFDKIKAAPHLMGQSGDWVASFDWVMKPSNIIKILEGNYDAKSNNSNGDPNGGTSAVAARNQIVAELEEQQRLRSGGGGNQGGFDLDG